MQAKSKATWGCTSLLVCQIGSIWAKRNCKNWTTWGQSKAKTMVWLSRAEQIQKSVLKHKMSWVLSSLRIKDPSPPFRHQRGLWCFREHDWHWETSPLTWHELQQAWNPLELSYETDETLVFWQRPCWWNALISSHAFATLSFCCHQQFFSDPPALQNRTNFIRV